MREKKHEAHPCPHPEPYPTTAHPSPLLTHIKHPTNTAQPPNNHPLSTPTTTPYLRLTPHGHPTPPSEPPSPPTHPPTHPLGARKGERSCRSAHQGRQQRRRRPRSIRGVSGSLSLTHAYPFFPRCHTSHSSYISPTFLFRSLPICHTPSLPMSHRHFFFSVVLDQSRTRDWACKGLPPVYWDGHHHYE